MRKQFGPFVAAVASPSAHATTLQMFAARRQAGRDCPRPSSDYTGNRTANHDQASRRFEVGRGIDR